MKNLIYTSSLEEGFLSGKCFVIKGLNLPCDLNRCISRATLYPSLFGYDKRGEEVEIQTERAFSDYLRNELKLNIVDAPFPVLDDDELPTALLSGVKQSKMDVCLTLTQAGSYTPIHTDPGTGGGWMYLQEGVKKWQLFDKSSEELVDPPYDCVCDEVIIKSGDFLYFTPLTPHRVWTFEKSFGISGYAEYKNESTR